MERDARPLFDAARFRLVVADWSQIGQKWVLGSWAIVDGDRSTGTD